MKTQWEHAATFWSLTLWFFVGFLPVLVIELKPADMAWSRMIEIVISTASALGTEAAAVIALYLGMASQRKSDREALERAELVATRLMGPVFHLHDLASRLLMFCECTPDPKARRVLVQGFASRAEGYLNFTTNELAALVPFGISVPKSLIAGTDTMRRVLVQVNQFTDEIWTLQPTPVQENDLALWQSELRGATAFLESAISTLRANAIVDR